MGNLRTCLLSLVTLWCIIPGTSAQQIGKRPEIHPRLTTFTCTRKDGCTLHKTAVVLDYFWRGVLDIHTGESCLTADFALNKTICPTVEACAKRCALEGVDYKQTGVITSPESNPTSVTLQMYHPFDGELEQVAPQIYLLDPDERDYVQLRLLNQEISFEVDVSKAPCGLDGAMYLAEMSASGGRTAHLNPAGAAYGTGYCDSQCSDTWPFINGVANIDKKGVCCNELDLWEANSRATQLTAHPCNISGVFACERRECSWHKGVCDRSGCNFQPYALGARDFYGRGRHSAIDTSRPFRVVTQFITHDGTSKGRLAEIRRSYVQDGKRTPNPTVKFNKQKFDSLSPALCAATAPDFKGLPLMGEAIGRGMTMVMGIWADGQGYNNWLDAGSDGPCNKREGKPRRIKENQPDASITFRNIRWGELGSTC